MTSPNDILEQVELELNEMDPDEHPPAGLDTAAFMFQHRGRRAGDAER